MQYLVRRHFQQKNIPNKAKRNKYYNHHHYQWFYKKWFQISSCVIQQPADRYRASKTFSYSSELSDKTMFGKVMRSRLHSSILVNASDDQCDLWPIL